MNATGWDHAVAAEIRSHMARQRRTQAEMARVLKLSQAAVSRRLSGETPITTGELYAVADWLDVSVTALLPDNRVGGTTTSGFSGRSRQIEQPVERRRNWQRRERWERDHQKRASRALIPSPRTPAAA